MITFDASSGGSGSGTSKTLSHTCTGTNLILWVYVLANSDACTGVTYAGQAMTQATKVAVSTLNYEVYLFYIINPATGANTIVASFTASTFNAVGGLSYRGVKQSGQPDASTTDSGTKVNSTCTLTTIADNTWSVLVGYASTAVSAGTNSTERVNNGTLGINHAWMGDSNGPKTPAGSFSMTANHSNGDTGFIMASFSPAPDTVGGAFLLNMI